VPISCSCRWSITIYRPACRRKGMPSRVAPERGYARIRNGSRESDFPHRHFFPPSQPLIDSGLPSRGRSETVFAAGGLTRALDRVLTQIIAADWPSFDEKSALRTDWFLTRLSDDDFHQGMAALRNPGDAVKQDDAVTEEIDWFVFSRLHGREAPVLPISPSSVS
jgi:hypothetical protein